MPKRGRPPKPSHLKLLQGNAGKRPINTDEPEPDAVDDLAAPEFLSPEAARKWQEWAPKLARNRLFTDLDTDLLAMYCEAYAEWRDAMDQLEKYGKIVKSPKSGYPVPNPYVAIRNTSESTMRSIASEFGMGPASRTRIHVKPKPNATPTGNSKKANARRLFDQG
jgi:P27 family predicted phage terminase small subunit